MQRLSYFFDSGKQLLARCFEIGRIAVVVGRKRERAADVGIDLPVALLGAGCGQLAGGRHLKYPLNTPFMNLGLTLLDKVGVNVQSIADSTGRLSDL